MGRPFVVLLALSIIVPIAAFESFVDRRIDPVLFPGLADSDAPDPPKASVTPLRVSDVQRDKVRVFRSRDFGSGCETISVPQYYDEFGRRARSSATSPRTGPVVALVGDSFTFGAEVEYDHTLQGRLDRTFPGAWVVNFGVSGSSSHYFAKIYEAFAARVGARPEALVVGIYTDMQIGDIPRNKAVAEHGDRVVFRGVPVSSARWKELRSSALERALFRTTVWLRRHSSTFNVIVPPGPNASFAISQKNALAEGELPANAAAVLSNVEALRQAAGLAANRVVVWLVPSNHDLYNRHAVTAGAAPRSPFHQLEFAQWSLIARELSAAGYHVVDVRDQIQDVYLRTGVHPYSCSGHFRPIAYELVSEAIVQVLRTLLPPSVNAQAAA